MQDHVSDAFFSKSSKATHENISASTSGSCTKRPILWGAFAGIIKFHDLSRQHGVSKHLRDEMNRTDR